MTVTQETDYPYDGRVLLRFSRACQAKLRIPGWCGQFTVTVNGRRETPEVKDGYIALALPDAAQVQLELSMPVRVVRGNPRSAELRGRVAFARGPVVYCAESCDQPGPAARPSRRPCNAVVLSSGARRNHPDPRGRSFSDSILRMGQPHALRHDRLSLRCRRIRRSASKKQKRTPCTKTVTRCTLFPLVADTAIPHPERKYSLIDPDSASCAGKRAVPAER